MAQVLGCPAEVTVYTNSGELNGMFGVVFNPYTGDGGPLIFIADGPTLDHDAARMILLHEIGHCRQWLYGGLREPAPWTEWNADTFAIEHAAEFGLDPDRLARDFRDWAQTNPDSLSHGSHTGRLLHFEYETTKRGYGIQGQ